MWVTYTLRIDLKYTLGFLHITQKSYNTGRKELEAILAILFWFLPFLKKRLIPTACAHLFIFFVAIFKLKSVEKEMPMLKNIPSNISPELMHVLMSMGHSDEIVIADGFCRNTN